MVRNSGWIDGFFGDGGKGNVLSAVLPEAARRVKQSYGTRPYDNHGTKGKPILVYSGVGGNNAANSFCINGHSVILRQLPGGLLIADNAFSQMGEEKYISPRKLKSEIESLLQRGISITSETLGIAPNAHVTLDFHIQADQKNLYTAGEHRSTGSGILQTAQDKYARTGIRFIEFLDAKLMEEILFEQQFPDYCNPFRAEHAQKIAESYAAEREFLAQFVKQDHEAFQQHGFEYKFAANAHGVGLDINAGLYPGITSSHPAKVPRWADTIFGIFKLYVSSVGARDRAFVSRMDLELEAKVRKLWGERGTGTGKNRMLGWFDAVLARYALQAADMDYVIATCGDRLADLHSLGAKPQIVVAYELEGKRYEQWQESFHRRDTLYRVKPITIVADSWEQFTEADRKTLTPKAKKYIQRIESELGKKFVMLMQGSRGEDDAIFRTHPLDL